MLEYCEFAQQFACIRIGRGHHSLVCKTLRLQPRTQIMKLLHELLKPRFQDFANALRRQIFGSGTPLEVNVSWLSRCLHFGFEFQGGRPGWPLFDASSKTTCKSLNLSFAAFEESCMPRGFGLARGSSICFHTQKLSDKSCGIANFSLCWSIR